MFHSAATPGQPVTTEVTYSRPLAKVFKLIPSSLSVVTAGATTFLREAASLSAGPFEVRLVEDFTPGAIGAGGLSVGAVDGAGGLSVATGGFAPFGYRH